MLSFAAPQPASLLPLSVLPMPVWLAVWQSALGYALQAGAPEAAPEPPHQPATEAQTTDVAEPHQPGTLRIGDYTIGEANCPELYGHPDIRY